MLKNNIVNDYNKRVNFYKKENLLLLNKLFLNNKILEKKDRQLIYNAQNKAFSKMKIKNRCLISGRGRAIIKFLKFSRIQLKNFHDQKLICGLKQSSW